MAQVRVSLDWPLGVFLVGGQWFTVKKWGKLNEWMFILGKKVLDPRW